MKDWVSERTGIYFHYLHSEDFLSIGFTSFLWYQIGFLQVALHRAVLENLQKISASGCL